MFFFFLQRISEHVTDEHLEKGSLYPPLDEITKCSLDIAEHIAKYAYKNG
jgi:malate dehydrogenase (oxaloacetate-decarboxylating)(NADP+)